MPCYRPLAMYDTGSINPDTGKRVFKFLGKAKSMLDINDSDRDNYYLVPCNRCIGCRLDYAREWSNRMLLELADNPKGLFVTLTYNNDHVPYSEKGYMSTRVRDCQLWMKRLRKNFPHLKIRYFLGAEYGPKNKRPHYHAILFGIGLDDFNDIELYKVNNIGQSLYISKSFADIWGNGFCTIGNVTKDSCAYTARYMLKKLKGFSRIDYYAKGIEPEFSLCSRRPGIGLGYLKNHPNFSNTLFVFDGSETVSFPMPKRLFDQLLEVDPDQYYVLKAVRREAASAREYLEYMKSDMEYLDYLDLKETQAYNRIKGVATSTRLDI